MPLAFVPGVPVLTPRLLARFLPPLADGVAAAYVRRFSQPGDLILDPYGVSPSVALEALALERRVVVAALNPILRLALSLAVRPPSAADLNAALTRLADVPVGRRPSERLEPQIRALYTTRCPGCGGRVTADYFDWDAEANLPVEKGCICLACGGPQHGPVDEADVEQAGRFARAGPDYHFLLAQVAGPNDADRPHAVEALAAYPARTLSAIGAVLVKLDGMDLGRDDHRLLAGLLVAAFDQTTLLAQDRPKALVVPRRYRETNFWLALEQAVNLVAGVPAPDRALPLEELLAADRGPAIHAFPGAVRDLAARLPAGGCPLIIAALPRPNQAFWTLSAVWAAWLWGREAAEPIRAVLRRRRYDWSWHARALERTLGASLPLLAADGRVVGLVAEAEPGFNAAALAAGRAAGLRVEGAATRADGGEAQFVWALPDEAEAAEPGVWPGRAREVEAAVGIPAAMTAALRARAEPSRWMSVHFAAWMAVAGAPQPDANADDLVGPTNREIEAAARDAHLFARLGAEAGDDVSTGLWWLSGDPDHAAPSLADRVEAAVRAGLLARAALDEYDWLPELYAAFPGAETPGRGLVQACLASYAERLEAGVWRLRPEDAPEARAQDMEWLRAQLCLLGARQGYAVDDALPVIWSEGGEPEYAFAILCTAELGPVLVGPPPPARRGRFLVLPGGRAGLAELKLRRDPRLRASLAAGRWTIVKYRHIRRMLGDAGLTRATLEPALSGDPLEAARQLALPE
jgi:hypothetical protein